MKTDPKLRRIILEECLIDACNNPRSPKLRMEVMAEFLAPQKNPAAKDPTIKSNISAALAEVLIDAELSKHTPAPRMAFMKEVLHAHFSEKTGK